MTLLASEIESPPENFGDRLRLVRERRGLDVADLARLLGVSEGALRRWEIGQVAPRANRMPIIAGTLSVPMRWLMSGDVDVEGLNDDAGASRMRDLELLHEVRSLKEFTIGAVDRLTAIETRLHSLASNVTSGDSVDDKTNLS